jgi:hypothetical protein
MQSNSLNFCLHVNISFVLPQRNDASILWYIKYAVEKASLDNSSITQSVLSTPNYNTLICKGMAGFKVEIIFEIIIKIHPYTSYADFIFII